MILIAKCAGRRYVLSEINFDVKAGEIVATLAYRGMVSQITQK